MGIFQSIRLILKSRRLLAAGGCCLLQVWDLSCSSGLVARSLPHQNQGIFPRSSREFSRLVAIGPIVGGPVAGQLSDRVFHSRKGLALVGLGLYAL